MMSQLLCGCFFFFQAEDGIRDATVTGVQTCALPIFPTTLGFPAPPPPAGGTVPNVVGMKQADAERTLAKANFTPFVQTGPSTEPAGVVFSQTPAGGAHATLGSRVTIMVSNGKAPKVPVPNVVGRTQAQATSILKGAGFVVNVVDQPDPDPKNDGIVLQQVPSGGKKPVGSTVTIYVG